jgi:hypothetical protein
MYYSENRLNSRLLEVDVCGNVSGLSTIKAYSLLPNMYEQEENL